MRKINNLMKVLLIVFLIITISIVLPKSGYCDEQKCRRGMADRIRQ